MTGADHRELTFEVGPFGSGQSVEESLTTVPFGATVLSVSYTPRGRFLFWNRTHMARNVTLSTRRQDPDRDNAVVRDVMVAWVEDVGTRKAIDPGEEFLLPLVEHESSLNLAEGDELYWVARSVVEGDTEGDPGGTVKVVLRVEGQHRLEDSMPVPSVPEEFEQIHIPARVLRSMQKQNIPVLEVADTIHTPDRVSHYDNVPKRWVAERDVEGESTIQAEFVVRHRPPEPWDEEWAEIEAERAVEVAVHTTDPTSVVELNTAVVVKLVTRTNRKW